MAPNIHINFVAVLLAAAGSFFLGFIWYSFIFNKIWMREMGINAPTRPEPKQMLGILFLNFISTLLMAWVFSHNLQSWDARSWGHSTNFVSNNAAAIMGAIFTWLGFYVPQDINKVIFQNRTWKLAGIDTAFNLCSLLVTAFILTRF